MSDEPLNAQQNQPARWRGDGVLTVAILMFLIGWYGRKWWDVT